MRIFRKLNRPIKMTVGIFNLLKGIAMLIIVYAHNSALFPSLSINNISSFINEGAVNPAPYVYILSIIVRLCLIILGAIAVSMMPTLFILSGYGVRKRTISKSFALQFKELVKPYLIVIFVTVIMNFVLHFCFFRYMPGAFQESLKVLVGMSLGFSQNVQIGEYTFFANGPIWFVLALFWSLFIFNILLNMVDEVKIKYYAFGISVIGWLLSFIKFTPFCLSQGLVGVLYVYFGYYVKKGKILTSELSKDTIIKYTLYVIVPNIIITSFGFVTEMADNVYSLGPISYVENGLLGIGVIYVFMRTNSFFEGKVSNALRYLGRYSLYFMMIHTVDMIAIPWYVIADKFTGHQLVGCFVVFVIRLIIIILALIGVLKIIGLCEVIMSRIKRNEQ